MHIAFVILNYINADDTIECVNSILDNICNDNYSIIIVDNASPNGSGELLLNKFQSYKNIKVLINSENMGFAKGNNVGFRYAKNKLNADFIIVLNNDTLIKQGDFCDRIIDIFNKEQFFILGPDIISLLDGGHQNPFRNKISSKKEVGIRIIKTKIKLILNYFNAQKIIQLILLIRKSSRNNISYVKKKDKIYDGVLHGSCLIFSKKYSSVCDGLYDGTFMYGEEEILFYICKKLNYKYLYSPEIYIYHKESSSVNTVMANKNRNQIRFFYKSKLNSYIHLYKIMTKKVDFNSLLKSRN